MNIGSRDDLPRMQAMLSIFSWPRRGGGIGIYVLAERFARTQVTAVQFLRRAWSRSSVMTIGLVAPRNLITQVYCERPTAPLLRGTRQNLVVGGRNKNKTIDNE